MEPLLPRWVGARVSRVEDIRLLSGRGRYVDDITAPGMLVAAFVRSPHAAARIDGIDVEAARAMPGVYAVWTAADLNLQIPHTAQHLTQPILAADEVRYVGEPVAVVVAADRYHAEDAAERVKVAYTPLPPVLEAHAAATDAPRRVHADVPNRFFTRRTATDGFEGAWASAPHHLALTFRTQRQTGVTLEPRACLAWPDPSGDRLTVYVTHQSPHGVRTQLAQVLGWPEHRIRVVVPEVGGGFGIKAMFYPEYAVVAEAARRLARPVKWVSDRTEAFWADAHARDAEHAVEVAYDDTGRILAVRDQVWGDQGAWPFWGFPGAVGEATWATDMLPGPYRIEHVAYDITCVYTNKAPLGPYRGVGGPIGAQVQEGIIEAVARAVGKDPVEVRRVNLIPPDAFPYRSATGQVYDAGSYGATLDRALALLDVERFRREQARARQAGRYLGLGLCVFVEPSAFAQSEAGSIPYEAVSLRMEPTGTVTAACGLGPTGQGHETTLAQIIADTLGIRPADVTVLHGDTDSAPFGGGTGGSRSGTIGGGAAIRAGQALRAKLVRLAAHLLEAAPEDIELANGEAIVAGVPGRAVPLADLARIAYEDIDRLPPGMEPGLEVLVRYRPPGAATYSNGTHAALVEVDVATGIVRVLDYVVVNDCGVLINPLIVEGQIHGGVAQGLGSAWLERLAYDGTGQLLTTSLMDYLLPTALDVPRIRVEHLETPSPSEGGFKGMGEGSLIGAPAALANAVSDALAPFGVLVTELPITPDQVLAWVTKAKSSA
jgi:carbon-monoxide dehydrogenase large subunit